MGLPITYSVQPYRAMKQFPHFAANPFPESVLCVQRSTILGTPVTKGPLVTISVIVSAITYLLRDVRVTPAFAIAPGLFCLNEMTLKKDFLGESIRYQDKKRTLR